MPHTVHSIAAGPTSDAPNLITSSPSAPKLARPLRVPGTVVVSVNAARLTAANPINTRNIRTQMMSWCSDSADFIVNLQAKHQ